MIKNIQVKLMLLALAALSIGCERDKGDAGLFGDPKDKKLEQNLHEAPDSLKELSWLVGSWIDQDENIDVNSTYRWDKGGHFLIEHFVMKITESDDLEGYQIIGWDPVEDRLHSWIFDTDGGYGESVWTKLEGSWLLNTVFTLYDGRKASATHIYTKIDDNTYTFESENRDIDGEVLPDIGPFNVVKKR